MQLVNDNISGHLRKSYLFLLSFPFHVGKRMRYPWCKGNGIFSCLLHREIELIDINSKYFGNSDLVEVYSLLITAWWCILLGILVKLKLYKSI